MLEPTSIAHTISQLLIDCRHAQMRFSLVLTRSEVMRICWSDSSKAVPNQIAELVVDVWASRNVLIGTYEDIALVPLVRIGDGEVP